jgi:hypothetical protein
MTTINYMRLEELLDRQHPSNPKEHDTGAIISSIRRFGFVEAPAIDEKTGYCVAGHGRMEALASMMKAGEPTPDNIAQDKDGHWTVPVLRGISFRDQAHVNAYLVASNRLTMLGGWDDQALVDMLSELASEPDDLLAVTGYDGDDLDMMLAKINGPEEWQEYDESIADTVPTVTCPECGHKWAP